MAAPLTDRVAVITGGGRGIGAAIARAFASAGAHVVVAGRTKAPLTDVVHAVRAADGRADWVRCDVARPDEVIELAAATRRLAGPATIVVANAGIAQSFKFVDTDEATWNEIIDTNLGGAYRVTRAFIADVLAAGTRGRVLYIGSSASRIGIPYTAAYCASKHGLLGLARALATEIASKGPTVNVVCPGWVDTDMADEAIRNIAARTGRTQAEARGELERMSPQRRLMTPTEIAEATLFLATDAARGITGQAWSIDGGQVMA